MNDRHIADPQVAVIGLGAMGAALARAQINAGWRTHVWNRSDQKAAPLIDRGALWSPTAAGAVLAADVILICVDTYDTAQAVLEAVLRPGQLTGKTLVNLGTSTPEEARRFVGAVTAAGGLALDGAIMFYPDSVGPECDGPLLIAGDAGGSAMAEPHLRQISGNLIHMGETIAAPSAMDLSLLTISASLYAGVAHAARICESEGADLDVLARLCAHGPRARERLEIIARDAFALNSLHDGGALGVWADVAQRVETHAETRGINKDVPAFLRSLYGKAKVQHAGEDVAALVKLLRADAP